jgi:hypothetical protein
MVCGPEFLDRKPAERSGGEVVFLEDSADRKLDFVISWVARFPVPPR